MLGTTGQDLKQSSSLEQSQLGGPPGTGLAPKGLHPFLPMDPEPTGNGLPTDSQPPGNLGLSDPFLMMSDCLETTTFKLNGISCCSHSS